MPTEPPDLEKIAELMPMRRAFESDQRAAGIARIDGGVRLDEEAIVGNADLRARQRRHDALRHRLADAEGIADRQYEIADFQRIGIADLDRRQLSCPLEFQHRKIGARIAQHDVGRIFAPILQRDLHVGHVLDDVIVGDDETVVLDDHAGAERLRRALAPARLSVAEEAAEDRIVEQRIARRLLGA